MNRQEFEEIAIAHGDPVIAMCDGRMGVCPHHDDTNVLVDAFRGNECETVRVPFSEIIHLGNGALLQRSRCAASEADAA